jgi:hypothetical protein
MVKSKLVQILIAIALLLLTSGLGSAGLGVGGAKLVEDIAPGDNINHVMKVQTRSSDQPMDILVDILGYGQRADGSFNILNASDDTSPYTARPFLSASPTSFHLNPGDSQEVKLVGNIPKDAGSGGRYALVKISNNPTGNGTVTIGVAVVVPVMLTILGSEILNRGEIEDLTVEKPVASAQQKLSIRFKNTGNHHYSAKADAVLKDSDGHILTNASSSLGQYTIPTFTRVIALDLKPKTPLKPGTYNVDATVSMADGTVLASKETSFEVQS